MKNYKVRALFSFNDTVEKTENGTDTPRKNGDVWNCTKERYEFLKDHKAVELVGIDKIEEPKVEIKEIKDEIVKEIKKPRTTTMKSRKIKK